jgi:hypothetical protein
VSTVVDGSRWDGQIVRLTDRAMTLAAGTDDATKAATLLTEHAQTIHLDRLGLFAGCRYRLAGVLDQDPGDLVALVALGLVALAALEGPDGDADYGGPQPDHWRVNAG